MTADIYTRNGYCQVNMHVNSGAAHTDEHIVRAHLSWWSTLTNNDCNFESTKQNFRVPNLNQLQFWGDAFGLHNLNRVAKKKRDFLSLSIFYPINCVLILIIWSNFSSRYHVDKVLCGLANGTWSLLCSSSNNRLQRYWGQVCPFLNHCCLCTQKKAITYTLLYQKK